MVNWKSIEELRKSKEIIEKVKKLIEIVKRNIMYDGKNTNNITYEQTESNMVCNHDKWIYTVDNETINIRSLDKIIKDARTAKEKLEVIKLYIERNHTKNRFAINSGD